MTVADLHIPQTNTPERNRRFLEQLLQRISPGAIAQPSELAPWLSSLRQRAAATVHQGHFPTKQDEEWRFLNLAPLAQGDYHRPTAIAPLDPQIKERFTLKETQGRTLVLVNGIYAPDLSDCGPLPEGLYLGNLAGLTPAQHQAIAAYCGQSADQKELFTALNTAGLQDVAIVWAQENTQLDQPIQILNLSVYGDRAWISQPRSLVIAEAHARLTVVEYFAAASEDCSDYVHQKHHFTNGVTEIFLGENAQLHHLRIQRDFGDAYHIGKTAIAQEKHSRYTCVETNLGAKVSRHNLHLSQGGEQTHSELLGLTMIARHQEADTHSAVHLNHPHGTVNQLHKCIVDDGAHSVFNGKVFVPQNAQMTNVAQLNRNLVLSPKARVDTKPELQITADNVKCAHGATVSQLEDDEIFYLRSRGLNDFDARHLLIDAFAVEIIEKIAIPSLVSRLSQCVACRTFD